MGGLAHYVAGKLALRCFLHRAVVRILRVGFDLAKPTRVVVLPVPAKARTRIFDAFDWIIGDCS
ncbi:hypothetical protein VNPA110516_20150 [Pseudomonas aeruginosa]|nr:hypothetical protein VNPA110516_20150 [Pseudomonas aeruginosa]